MKILRCGTEDGMVTCKSCTEEYQKALIHLISVSTGANALGMVTLPVRTEIRRQRSKDLPSIMVRVSRTGNKRFEFLSIRSNFELPRCVFVSRKCPAQTPICSGTIRANTAQVDFV
jgi:hypothetical protein